MKSFKKFLKQLKEDIILAKEDEGGAAIGGEVMASGGESTPSGDIQTAEPSVDTGLKTTDVLGKCDHKHDGFFGPGCFHRPYPIFSYPVSRIKHKKRKYIKVLDLTESEEYGKFYPKAQQVIKNEINNANDFYSKIGLGFHCVKEYDFEDDKVNWISDIIFEDRPDNVEFGIAFNLPLIYGHLEDNSLENDEIELKCQIKAILYHEIGHCLINKLRSEGFYDFADLSYYDEEKIVDEFTKFMMSRYTGVKKSRLNNFINTIFSDESEELKLNETKYIKRGKFFVNPINIEHIKRKMSPSILKTGKFGKIIGGFKNILVKSDENIFSIPEGEKPRDYLVSLTDEGYLSLKVQNKKEDSEVDKKEELENDEVTKQYMKLSDELKEQCIQIINYPEATIYTRMSEQGTFPEELEDFWLTSLDMKEEDRQLLINKLKKAQEIESNKKYGESEIIYLRPTVADLIRIFHDKKETLPVQVLILVDQREIDFDYRCDETLNIKHTFKDLLSEEDYEEENQDLLKDRLLSAVLKRNDFDGKYTKGKVNRWALMTKQLGPKLENINKLGRLVYAIDTNINDKRTGPYRATMYIYSAEATEIGMKRIDTRNGLKDVNTTFFYAGPSDIIYRLRQAIKGEDETVVISGNKYVEKVPMDLLWQALLNVVNDKCFKDSDRNI